MLKNSWNFLFIVVCWDIFTFLFNTLTILAVTDFALLEVPINFTEYAVECKFRIFETQFEKNQLSNLCTFALTYRFCVNGVSHNFFNIIMLKIMELLSKTYRFGFVND